MAKKGYCELCGKKIPQARLEALPDTKTCVHCSQTDYYTESEALGTVSMAEQEINFNVEEFETDEESFNFDSDNWSDSY